MVRQTLIRAVGFLYLLLGILHYSVAQNIKGYPGLFRSGLTITPSALTDHGLTGIYLHSFSEIFTEPSISLRGDDYIYLGTQQKNVSLLKQNSHLLFGAALHHTSGLNDMYAGLEPGISYTQLQVDSAARILPSISVFAGYHFSVWKYLNFFAEVRYVNLRYADYPGSNLWLNEVLFSAGLGLQIPFKKL